MHLNIFACPIRPATRGILYCDESGDEKMVFWCKDCPVFYTQNLHCLRCRVLLLGFVPNDQNTIHSEQISGSMRIVGGDGILTDWGLIFLFRSL
jgi:uncharacterized protein YbaR (Trm112 family)